MNTPSKEALAPITADEISAWRKDAESYHLRADDAGRLAERMLRLLSEREPVGDGEVKAAIATLDELISEAAAAADDNDFADEFKAIAIFGRLARQYAEQKALLAELNPTGAPGIAVFGTLDFFARRDALLNQEGRK